MINKLSKLIQEIENEINILEISIIKQLGGNNIIDEITEQRTLKTILNKLKNL